MEEEKRKPKIIQVELYNTGGFKRDQEIYICPKCKREILPCFNYCPNCGQGIIWNEGGQ